MKKNPLNAQPITVFSNRLKQTASIFVLIFLVIFSLDFSTSFVTNKNISESLSIATTAKATHNYYNFSGGSLTLTVTRNDSRITTNNDWSAIPSVEGFCGSGLTDGTAGIDPRTIKGTEYPNNALPQPSGSRIDPCVNADKGNPSAFNGSGITEFDRPRSDSHLGIGFQGNVQNNPYLVFYLNTTGQNYVRMSYDIIDIDEGNNSSYSQMALQYRVGETGDFINLPDGYAADPTDGPNLEGRVTKISATLPPEALNQPKVQVRILHTFASSAPGSNTQTPNEWVGVNNIIITNNNVPTAASVSVAGRAMTAFRRPVTKALVTMTDSMGNTRSAVTNPFGYYRFDDVQVGEGYVFTIYSKRYIFTEPTQFRLINGEENSLNFLAEY